MNARPLFAAAVLSLVAGGLLLGPVPQASSQDASPDTNIEGDIKHQIKIPVSAGNLSGDAGAVGSSAAERFGSPGSNVQVSQDQDPASVFRSGASEMAIATTKFGQRGVIGWNDGEGFGFAPFDPDQPPLGLSGYGYSSDGGRTWTDGGAPPIGDTVAFGPGPAGHSETGNYVTRGDPWLDVDSPLKGRSTTPTWPCGRTMPRRRPLA